MHRAITPLVLAAATLAPTAEALACGGFFCDNRPMDQSKERIVFGIDEVEGKVDVHVQIFYSGTAEKFAWVVPVAGVPDVRLSSDQLFQQLEWQTGPIFNLNWEERGTCTYDGGWGYPSLGGAVDDDASAPEADNGAGGGVDVLSSGQTGPYDWVVIEATSQTALLEWLDDPNDDGDRSDAYAIPDDVGEALGTYVADGSKFVAFKLTSDSDAGDIAPVRLTFDGDEASIPLVLTSIAATPDMRLQPYVFADARAVPSNYLHVRINEAAINWLTWGNNYDEVITKAADEAGGQAFATDFFGSTVDLRNQLYQDGRFDLASLRQITDPAQFVNSMLSQGFPRGSVVQNIIRDHIPMPQEAVEAGLSEMQFYNCLSCYPEYTSLVDFAAGPMVDDLDERIVQPMADAEQLFHDHRYVTRMTSSMSPDEMTLDPRFVINRDMTDTVDRLHEAKLVIDCGDNGNWSEAPRWIEIENDDGSTTVIQVPPDTWFWDNNMTYDQWLDGIDQPAAGVIEQTAAEGQPQPVQDNNGSIDDALDAWNRSFDDEGGPSADPTVAAASCGGCSTGGTSGGVALLGLVGLLGLRRRR